jgi:hypothetical protein
MILIKSKRDYLLTREMHEILSWLKLTIQCRYENEIQNQAILIHIGRIDSKIPLLTINLFSLMRKYSWQAAIYVKIITTGFVINVINIDRFVIREFWMK